MKTYKFFIIVFIVGAFTLSVKGVRFSEQSLVSAFIAQQDIGNNQKLCPSGYALQQSVKTEAKKSSKNVHLGDKVFRPKKIASPIERLKQEYQEAKKLPYETRCYKIKKIDK